MHRRTDPKKNNAALAHPYHEGKSGSKFGRILPSTLGDSMLDRRPDVGMDGQMETLTISPLLFQESLGITIIASKTKQKKTTKKTKIKG